MLAYKGFDKDFKCRGHQFVVGETYKHVGNVSACKSGFHACIDPMDVWQYYGPYETRYARVECSGKIDTHKDDSKVACETIMILEELSLPAFLQIAINSESAKMKPDAGHSSKLAVPRYYSQLAASGHYSQLAAFGDSSQLAAFGDSSQLAASGDSSKLAASGDSSKLAVSGHYSQLAASGHYSQLATSGDSSQLAASGHHSVIASSGIDATAKGIDGTWISLAEFDINYKCLGFATGCIGKDGLEPNVDYIAKGGKLCKK